MQSNRAENKKILLFMGEENLIIYGETLKYP